MLGIDEGPIRRAEGMRQAQAIFGRYRLAEDDWRTDPLIANLDDPERCRELEGKLADLLLVAARKIPPAEALPLLERAEDLFGKHVPAALWLQRAAVLEALGRMGEGRVLRDRAKAQPPAQARDYYMDGRARMLARKFREALPLLKRAALLDPRSLPAALLLGICHDSLDNFSEAIACYDVCLALDPEFHGGYFNRGLVYSRLRNYAAAIDNYSRALVLRPESLDGHLNRGLSRLEWGQARLKDLNLQTVAATEFTHTLLKDAVADFTRVLEQDPSQTRVLFFRSRARRLLKDEPAAEADFKEGLKRDPGEDDRSWNARGYQHLYRNEVQEALRCFDRGIAVNPRSLGSLTGKAYLLSDYLHKPAEALVLCNLVLNEFPDYLYGHFNRGILLARMGRHGEAAEDARKSLERGNSAEMLYRVACIYALTSQQNKDDADLAIQLLHEALRGGFGAAELPDDGDLKPLHSLPEFARLVGLARSLTTPPKSANR